MPSWLDKVRKAVKWNKIKFRKCRQRKNGASKEIVPHYRSSCCSETGKHNRKLWGNNCLRLEVCWRRRVVQVLKRKRSAIGGGPRQTRHVHRAIKKIDVVAQNEDLPASLGLIGKFAGHCLARSENYLLSKTAYLLGVAQTSWPATSCDYV